MYGHDPTGGCGCGGGTVSTQQRYGHIDSQGRCVCGECELCTGLTCQCRPRFYDGQLLSAADFNRLDQYIVAKDRLHNRYLHGVGVVCGLEAVCSACDDTVTVRPGYALGPCGEDIVVCADAAVDVAALIRAQRRGGTVADCAPYSEPVPPNEAVQQKWVLGVCYDERPSRPVTSLKRAGGGCSCGGSCGGGGGCSCGGSCGGSTSVGTCEPTQVCEGYRFTLTRLETPERKLNNVGQAQTYAANAAGDGQLPEVVKACLARLQGALTKIPSDPSQEQLVSYARELKADLRDLIETGNVHDCLLAQRLNNVVIPAVDDQEATAKAQAAVVEMFQIVIDLFRECICSALLPPCGVSCADDCVPLAVVTVRSSDSKVLDICNWSARKFVITMPTLSYWFGWLPVFGVIRASLERLCCTRRDRRAFEVDDKLRVTEAPPSNFSLVNLPVGDAAEGGGEEVAGTVGGAPETKAATTGFASLAGQYAEAWSSLSGLESTVLGALGAQGTDKQPLASVSELEHPLAALALGRLGAQAGATLLPPEVRGSLGGLLAERISTSITPGGGGGSTTETPASEKRLTDLESRLTKLQRKVDTQARTIRELRTGGTKK